MEHEGGVGGVHVGHGGAVGSGEDIQPVGLREPGAMHQHATARAQVQVHPAPRLVRLQREAGQFALAHRQRRAGVATTQRPACTHDTASDIQSDARLQLARSNGSRGANAHLDKQTQTHSNIPVAPSTYQNVVLVARALAGPSNEVLI